ncbi:MAG: hypothetical protein A2033_03535 [Bacteroidetes bacterium GWA2_31_9]|nr:MAG: hypothetical protein A2033_03535 [Bacteroidetes bacterium GWA2_31_9]
MKLLIKTLLFSIAFFHLFFIAKSQNDSIKNPILIEISNNSTQLPGSGFLGIFNLPFHPSITIGKKYNFVSKPKHDFFESVKFSYLNHRLYHNAFQLSSWTGYEYKAMKKFNINASLGFGYLYSIISSETFTLNENGEYEYKKFYGRSHFTAGLDLNLIYKLQKLDLYFGYKFWVQSPFVNGYVPVLPYTSITLGSNIYF